MLASNGKSQAWLIVGIRLRKAKACQFWRESLDFEIQIVLQSFLDTVDQGDLSNLCSQSSLRGAKDNPCTDRQ